MHFVFDLTNGKKHSRQTTTDTSITQNGQKQQQLETSANNPQQ